MWQEVTRRKTIRRGAWMIAAVGLAGAGWLIQQAGAALIVSHPLAAPDAIVSLASHEWERLPETARLAARHPEAVVLLTDPPVVTEANCHDCPGRVERLQALGVPPSRIRHVPIVTAGTHGEALAVRAFAAEHRLRRLVIVTSPYHTRRSLATFTQVLGATDHVLGVAPAPVSPPVRPGWWWWVPYDRAYVAYEWAAVSYYWWKHGVPLRLSGFGQKSAAE